MTRHTVGKVKVQGRGAASLPAPESVLCHQRLTLPWAPKSPSTFSSFYFFLSVIHLICPFWLSPLSRSVLPLTTVLLLLSVSSLAAQPSFPSPAQLIFLLRKPLLSLYPCTPVPPSRSSLYIYLFAHSTTTSPASAGFFSASGLGFFLCAFQLLISQATARLLLCGS